MTARSTAWVSFDGKNRQELFRGDKIVVRRSEYPFPTMNASDMTADFVSSLVTCLNWNEREEQKPLPRSEMPDSAFMDEDEWVELGGEDRGEEVDLESTDSEPDIASLGAGFN